ncbi:MAG: hypothetical protein K6F61_08260 [Clostridiales bacterium]|nr:hypothetical protein [Clostridiales bacterium]
MDKMEGLRAGVVEMRSVAKRLMEWADDLEASFQGSEAPAAEVPAAELVPVTKRKKGEGGKTSVGKAAAEEKRAQILTSFQGGSCLPSLMSCLCALVFPYQRLWHPLTLYSRKAI